MKTDNTTEIIRLDNKLVYQGSYSLPVRALKTLCYVISKYVDPYADRLPEELHIPITEIEKAISQDKGGKSKALYTDIQAICKELTSNPIRFKTSVEVEGLQFKGYVNWCSSALPYRDKNGHVFVRLGFDKLMSQFLLGLAEYVRLYRPELNRLKKSYAIRLFQMLKGIRNRRGKYEQVSVETYSIDHLKFLFAISDKYPQYKDFNKRVIKPSVKAINDKTTVHILKLVPIRNNRRQIIELEFHFTDRDIPGLSLPAPHELKSYEPSKVELKTLSWAKKNAFDTLVTFGVMPGIAFKQLLPGIKGSEFVGYEDYFVQYALEHFKKWANQQNSKSDSAATLVHWWLEKKIYDSSGDVWATMLEKVNRAKKELRQKEPEKFDNRKKAAGMTEEAFREWYKNK